METTNFSVINHTDTSQYKVFGGRQNNMLFVGAEKKSLVDKTTGLVTAEWYETSWVNGREMYHMNCHKDSNIDKLEVGKIYNIDISLVEEVIKTKSGNSAYSCKMRVLGVYGDFNLPFKDKETKTK